MGTSIIFDIELTLLKHEEQLQKAEQRRQHQLPEQKRSNPFSNLIDQLRTYLAIPKRPTTLAST
ncbi:hypothetical protein KFU94_20140 [Chloroflexi bacterium TSY]|nr:hypothetical protein [Chloroflexi bacterium TSY]